EPIEGVSSALIFKDVNCPEKVMITKSELMDFLADENIDVLMTLGAGDIDRFVPQITDMLEKR
ncbi:MAG: UDP-N-acetylmuramate--L-alanine ligase, partial [Bacteroidetes bacterium]|nr:UDP-N-acetylmuramate--L-alanine ligase [Candidatus Cryptobacteroides avistercoris]